MVSTALVAVAEMRVLGVVVGEPGIGIGLRRLDVVVEAVAHLDAQELVEHRAVEVPTKAVVGGLRTLLLRWSLSFNAR